LYILSVYPPSLLFAKDFSWHFILLLLIVSGNPVTKQVVFIGWQCQENSDTWKLAVTRSPYIFWAHASAWVRKFCFFWNMHDSPFLNPFHVTRITLRLETQPTLDSVYLITGSTAERMCTALTL
jgi:hypothetical protein